MKLRYLYFLQDGFVMFCQFKNLPNYLVCYRPPLYWWLELWTLKKMNIVTTLSTNTNILFPHLKENKVVERYSGALRQDYTYGYSSIIYSTWNEEFQFETFQTWKQIVLPWSLIHDRNKLQDWDYNSFSGFGLGQNKTHAQFIVLKVVLKPQLRSTRRWAESNSHSV